MGYWAIHCFRRGIRQRPSWSPNVGRTIAQARPGDLPWDRGCRVTRGRGAGGRRAAAALGRRRAHGSDQHATDVQWGGPTHRVRPVYTPPPAPPAPPAPTPPPIVGAPVSGGCARNGIKVSGTISGEDGDYVNVMLGFDLQNSAHQAIGLNGCLNPSGYAMHPHLNYCVSAYGSNTANLAGAPAGCTLTKSWSVVLPGNAAYMYIEAYPKRASSGPAIGVTDQSKYGMSYRRAVSVTEAGSRALKLPVVCGQGGHTGNLTRSRHRRRSRRRGDVRERLVDGELTATDSRPSWV